MAGPLLRQIKPWLKALSQTLGILAALGGAVGFGYLVYKDHAAQELDRQRYDARLELVPQAEGERIRALLTNKGSQLATITSVSIEITAHEELPAAPAALISSTIQEEVAGTFLLPTAGAGIVQKDVAFKVSGNEVEALLLVAKVRNVATKSLRRKHKFDAILSFTYDGKQVSEPVQFAVTSQVAGGTTRPTLPKPGQGAAAAPGGAAK